MDSIAIIGAGPAGLMAAEQLAGAGHAVTVFDRMASPARKFLLAGRGGLNLTHAEALPQFLTRYDAAPNLLVSAIEAFPPDALRRWCEDLGQTTFIGSSGRVFPVAMKAANLLRAWLRRLGGYGVRFAPRHRWLGFGANGELRFATDEGERSVAAGATILALGGASWPRMGSDGAWTAILEQCGVHVRALRAANCGVLADWSAHFAARFEGQPLKRIAISLGGISIRGEAIMTREGLEGGAIYAHSAAIRHALDERGEALLHVDLRPDLTLAALSKRVDGARQGRSLGNFLRRQAGLSPVAIGLVQEALHTGMGSGALAALIKALPLRVRGMQSIGRAISSSGGLRWEELDEHFMLRRLPGVFAVGEMLDWDAPTGGYLLQACFSMGVAVSKGVLIRTPVRCRAEQARFVSLRGG